MAELARRFMGDFARRYLAPVTVVSVFYFGLLVYPVLRIWGLLLPPPGTGALLVIMVGPLLLRMAGEWIPAPYGRWLSAAALTWLGVCFLAFTLVLGWEVARWLVPLDDGTWGALLLIGVLGLSAYAALNAQRLRINELSVAVPEALRERVGGTRLAQISDVHIGSRRPAFLKRIVAATNAARPDHVLITGDLIDFRDVTREELAPLAGLEAPCYFIIGNHERYVDLEAICERLRALDIVVLRNASTTAGHLQIVGIDDADARDKVARELPALTADQDRYRILLYHRPDGAEDAERWGAHLMLCGHTHNGQLVPFNLLVRRIFPRILGRYEIGALTLYVSPGTGTWGPVLRLGSRSEIGIITLR